MVYYVLLFHHIMLYYFKKSKNTTETQRFVQYMEKVLWLIGCNRSLPSFILEISYWTMLHGLVDWSASTGRPVEVDSDQIETLIQNVFTTWEIANRLKISKSSTENYLHQLDYVNGFDIWILHKLSKKKIFFTLFLTLFPHEILYLNVMKMFHF